MCQSVRVFRLLAEDPAVTLDESQELRIKYVMLEFLPARTCTVKRDAPVEVTIVAVGAGGLHPPLLQRVEQIAGCRFRVTVVEE